ncbi:transcriptional repressor [Escherichia phage vB_EcoM_ECO1230-10]|uniref:Uncharacterized protein n=1 Tax=Escherichia phage vB_EcoM_ECO1230-10 TaxID=669875 RepID=D5LH18_9CAUD|nr:transcriptional repressor [Escherichia phage vB_EcoM_ECO1230-10]ADE87949.1 hypothetical protein [Escherichia phage vB_EcoM_ECO1230-10]EFJ2475485.1 hypothetical protein [Escherichia coli]
MDERTERLHDIMAKHGLTCRDVGRLLGRTEQTVLIWRCKGGKVIPTHQLELLEYKLSGGNKL